MGHRFNMSLKDWRRGGGVGGDRSWDLWICSPVISIEVVLLPLPVIAVVKV